MNKKLISFSLSIWMLFQGFIAPVGFVLAQESSPVASPIAVIEATSLPESTPTAPAASPVSSPSPTPTIPPYSSDEYDAYKEEKNKKEAMEEAREDEWNANEYDPIWVAAHGGNEEDYISGKWSSTATAAPTPTPTPAPSSSPTESSLAELISQEDPFASPSTDLCNSPAAAFVEETNTNVDATNNNCADIDNTSNASGISGDNAITQTDGDVALTIGDASANGLLENNANTNVTDTTVLEENGTQTESFSNEGASEEFSEENQESLDVENNNTAVVDNSMNVEGRSGGNVIEENDGNVELTTGDIELIANMLNILNLNITGDDFLHLIVNIFGSLNGTLDLDDIAVALGYEDDDAIEVIAQNKATTNVTNNNNAQVNNELNVTGVSGQNEVVKNDGEVNVVTGRIEILANVLNFINTNLSGSKWRFIMVNVFGSLNGDIVVPGTEQFVSEGDNSSINQSSGSVDQTEVSNTNNIELVNNVSSNGVTGTNEQIANDDDGHTATSGTTNVQNQILNYLNFNITGNNWVFLIVNVFGKWMGQIVGFGEEGTMEAPTEGSFAALSVGSGDAGPATGDVENNMSIANNNTAKVTNDINVEGISGGNKVNGNDGTTSINTGWVEIDTNLLNIINTNIAGRSWMVVFLNVFGDFMGNLFFGNEAKQNYELANAPIGGVSGNAESNSNPNSESNNSSNSHSNTQVLAAANNAIETKNKRTLKIGVLAAADESEEEVEIYTADQNARGFMFDDHEYQKSLLGILKNFMYNLVVRVKTTLNLLS